MSAHGATNETMTASAYGRTGPSSKLMPTNIRLGTNGPTVIHHAHRVFAKDSPSRFTALPCSVLITQFNLPRNLSSVRCGKPSTTQTYAKLFSFVTLYDIMSDDSFDLDALGRLGSEQQALLDTVDSLRGQGIQRDSLPQIVVVGDKSSGKSSVLEAISRVPFPVKSGLCTRSPTELILRKTAERRIVVQVCDTNSTRDGGFNKECVTKQDLPAAIEEAKEVMGIGDGAQDFSKETLRIEVSDIDLPRLTLVDLPGLYRTATTDETSEGIKTVRGLTEQYMGQKNTIILAVLAASSDIALQEVLDLAKKYDPTGERTIGVITKPDLLVQFSADERAYLRLLRNEEPTHSLKLGWHTLRNRTSTENDENNCGESKASDTDRDDKERNFFDAGAWSHISYQDKGVDALREKLSRILTKHVQLSLPPLIGDMERKLKRHQNDLEKLGDERSSTSERRGYLLNIASQFRDIARAATNGSYEGGFFRERKLPESRPGQLLDHSHQRKLRATIRNLNCAFDAVIATKGARRAIHWGDNVLLMDKDRLAALPNPLKPWIALYGVSEPVVVTSTDLQRELEIQATHSRGNQFPGSSNDRLALELFRDQAQNWQSIASKHLELVVSAAKVFVLEALQYIVGNNQTSMDAIHREYVDTFFEQRQASLKSKLRELIHHYQEGSVICLEDEFQRRMAKHHATNLALRVRDHLPRNKAEETFPHVFSRDDVYKTVLNAPMEKLDNFGLDRVIEMMTAYYKVRFCSGGPDIRDSLVASPDLIWLTKRC